MGGMMHLLLLLWAGVTVSTAADLHKRIIGGEDCGINDRHYHVKLTVNEEPRFVCGGSLIRGRWILTSAQCNRKGLIVHVAVHPHPDKAMERQIERTIPDPKGDIMLLKLTEVVRIPPTLLVHCQGINTPRLCFQQWSNPEKFVIYSRNANVQIAGHGPATTNDILPSATLKCVDLKVVKCPDGTNPERFFCGRTAGVKAFVGDAGGGVLFRQRLHGVFVGGGLEPEPLLNVCGYKQWINETIRNN